MGYGISKGWGLDADYLVHKNRNSPAPGLEVVNPNVVGTILDKHGNSLHTVTRRKKIPFGFVVDK
jgi:hypothetical protein